MRTSTLATTPILASYLSTGSFGMAEAVLQRLLPDGWTTEALESCDGKWSLVIMNAADDLSATYVLTETPGGFAVEELRGDVLSPVCECRTVGQLISILDVHIRAGQSAPKRAA